MPKAKHIHFCAIRALATAFYLMGIAYIWAVNGQLYLSQLSGGGVTLISYQTATLAQVQTLAQAAPENDMTIQWQTILGMVMILGGFIFHLMFLRRHKKPAYQLPEKTKALLNIK